MLIVAKLTDNRKDSESRKNPGFRHISSVTYTPWISKHLRETKNQLQMWFTQDDSSLAFNICNFYQFWKSYFYKCVFSLGCLSHNIPEGLAQISAKKKVVTDFVMDIVKSEFTAFSAKVYNPSLTCKYLTRPNATIWFIEGLPWWLWMRVYIKLKMWLIFQKCLRPSIQECSKTKYQLAISHPKYFSISFLGPIHLCQ